MFDQQQQWIFTAIEDPLFEMAEPKRPRTVTLNAYGATCIRCGYWVHEENGELLDKDPSTDRWQVAHLKGLCHSPTSAANSTHLPTAMTHHNHKKRRVVLPTGEEPWEQQPHLEADEEYVPGSDSEEEPTRPTPVKLVELESPYLTAQSCEGLPHQFYCVDTRKQKNVLYQDSFLVKLDTGQNGRLRFQNADPDSNHHIMPAATSRILIQLIREQGIGRCSKKYSDVTGNCYKCNRKLTDDVSIRHGLGPVCRGEKLIGVAGPRTRSKQRTKTALDDGDAESWSSRDEDGYPKNEMEGFIVPDEEDEDYEEEDEEESGDDE
jgi:hypothetical protein